MIGDIVVGLMMALLLYKPVLWVAKLFVRRAEELGSDVSEGTTIIKEKKHGKKNDRTGTN